MNASSQIVKQECQRSATCTACSAAACCRLRIKTGTVAADDLSHRDEHEAIPRCFPRCGQLGSRSMTLPRSRSQRIVPYRRPFRHAQSSMPNTRGPCAQGLIALRRS